jgi:hypothetical protein
VDDHLHGVTGANTGDGEQGDAWIFCRVVCDVIVIRFTHL